MVHGKKGFERIVWAFKNVLNDAVTWLFYDLNAKRSVSANQSCRYSPGHLAVRGWSPRGVGLPQPASGSSALSKHHPVTIACEMHSVSSALTNIPDSLNSKSAEPWGVGSNQDHALNIIEWLGLVSLQSPRIHRDDEIDPYLCRHSNPDEGHVSTGRLVVSQISGFIPAEWLRQLFIGLV